MDWGQYCTPKVAVGDLQVVKLNSFVLGLSIAVGLVFPATAHADVLGVASHLGDRLDGLFSSVFETTHQRPAPLLPINPPTPLLTATTPIPTVVFGKAMMVNIDPAKVTPPKPSVEKSRHKFFCVEYARMRSGLAVFGDAKLWWARAQNLYTRMSHPVEEAVMVFSGSRRLRRGHVAVVTDVVSPREIIVDQANWQNHGEIDHATPVLDVSKDNDWSQVRVWNIHSGDFGAHVYPISGFITKGPMRQARND